jgi:uncharacterized repeat protein (TIGR01451 family)
MTSTDIGVSEPTTTLVGYSLQLQGTGSGYDDFTWGGPIAHTRDAVNTGQTFQTSAPTISKDVVPTTHVAYHGTVTYTVVISNGTTVSDTNALFTDTLPISTTFGTWIEQPAGASESGDEITWSGTLTDDTAITFTFTATHTGDYEDVVLNTADYSGSVVISDTATFTVIASDGDVTFVYHDLEDVVQAGETVYIAGEFNSWNPSANPLSADAGMTVFSTTINMATGSYEYKYIVDDGSAQWDWLNTGNRSIAVYGDATVDDYRAVAVGWANLDSPATLETDANTATSDVDGQVYIQNVTNPAGEGRGIVAQVGYGDDADPANWDWFPMAFNTQMGNNDVFRGVMTPTVSGVYSYATRFDGNWGATNPNASWTYADLNGVPFSLDQTGVLTVNIGPRVEVTKTVEPESGVPTDGSGVVTYTINVKNSGDALASGVMLTDTLPTEVDFGAWIISATATLVASDEITWGGDVAIGELFTWTFTVTVNAGAPGATVVNTATVEFDGAVVEDTAVFVYEVIIPDGLVINEIDADTAGTEYAEFIELYDGGVGNAPLDGLVVVLFNGSDDQSYTPAIDLDGYTTDPDGYFVIGGTDLAQTNDITVTSSYWLQNGADAVAIIVGNAADFPNDTPVTTDNLVEAIVYGTSDPDDAGLLVLLNASQPQVDEGGWPASESVSNQRCPNGSGGRRNTDTYIQNSPTPGAANDCAPELSVAKTADPTTNVAYQGEVTYTIVLSNVGYFDDPAVLLTDTLPISVTFDRWVEQPAGAMESGDEITWNGSVTTAQTIDLSFVVSHTGDYEDVVVNTVEVSGTYNADSDDATFTVVSSPGLDVSKTAPASVDLGDTFAYTITAWNNTGGDLTNVVITDAAPANTTLAYALDGGIVVGDEVSWTTALLSDQQSVSVRFVVTATGPMALVSNADYYAWATEWITRETGPAADTTIVGAITPIGDARGMGGQTVTVAGRATMYTGGFYAGSNAKFYIQDGTGGISVLCFSSNGTLPAVTLGDLVTVTGEIASYNNEIQIQPADNVADVLVTDGDPSDVPAPLGKAIDEVDDDDDALGWLVNISGEATRVEEFSYRYEIDLTDGMGHTVLIYVDKETGIDLSDAEVGSSYVITGIAEVYYSTYQVKPRIQADVLEFAPETLQLRKSGPALVLQGQLFTYTLAASNNTALTLTNVVITDVIPAANAMLGNIGDGGVQVGDAISWTTASLASGEKWEVHFSMIATGTVGSHVVNDTFFAWASEWITRATGPAVDTEISAGCTSVYTPVYEIQGSSDVSPYDGQDVDTCGVVVGVAGSLDGVFIQDVMGDGNPATSDGVFVYRGYQGVAGVSVGDLVEVSGTVDEYYGCTQVSASGGSDVLNVVANQLPPPTAVPLDPPADRATADAYLETFEGMLTEVPVNANVVGPTNYYGELYVVRADTGVTRLVLQTDPPDGYRIGIDDGIVSTGEFKVGDVLGGFSGPLHYTFENYKVEPLAALTVVNSPPLPAWPSNPQAAADQFSVGAFNLLNFDGEDDALKLEKAVDSIEAMGAPLFLGLSEIATEDCWHIDNYTVTGVIDDLVAGLAAAGYNYDYLASHPDVGCHGVALLYDADRVTLDGWTTLQDCSPYGSSNADYDPLWATCQGQGEYPLFSRRPVVITGTVEYAGWDTQVVFVADHFKAKSGSYNEERRLGQANLVAGFAADLLSGGVENVVVAGDLNDFIDSPPLNALYVTGTLTNTFYTLPAEERYSYVYNGMSEVLDHILVSPALFDALDSFGPVHIDADYPAAWETAVISYGVSDHDPVLAYFDLGVAPAALAVTKSVEPMADVALDGVVTYTVVVRNDGQATANGVVLTDVLPAEVDFGAWIVQGSAQPPDPTDDVITWGPWPVAGGVGYTFSFTAIVTPPATYGDTVTNVVEFSSDDAGSGFSNDAVFTIVTQSDLSGSTKTVEPTGDVDAGDYVTYTVTLINSGQTDASVTITDTLPGELLLVSGFGGGTSLTWSGVVAGESQVELTLIVQADPDIAADTTVSNTVTIDDGVNAAFDIYSPDTTILAGGYTIYLPAITRNFSAGS